MNDTIKSYLVSLGFTIDEAAFKKMKDALGGMDKTVTASTLGAARGFAIMGGAAVTAFTTVSLSLFTLIDKVAKADLGYQKFALRMYMARDAAKQFKIVTDAMGEDPNDIAWIPELNARYRKHMEAAARMELPAEAQEYFRKWRDLTDEVTRLKITTNYFLQTFTYEFLKKMDPSITKAKKSFADLNRYFEEKMREWALKLADWSARFYSGVVSFTQEMSVLWGVLKGIFSLVAEGYGYLWDLAVAFGILSDESKGTTGSIKALWIAFKDFVGYVNGQDSKIQMDESWQNLLDLLGWLNEEMLRTMIIFDKFFSKDKQGRPGWHKALGQILGEDQKEPFYKPGDVTKEIESLYEDMDRLGISRPGQRRKRRESTPQPVERPSSYEGMIQEISRKYGVDPNLIRALIRQESGFNPYDVSRSGAQGLMQIMPKTAKSLGLTNPFDPYANIDAGVRYFADLKRQYGSDVLALRAYNAGMGRMAQYGNNPPFKETQDYVSRIMSYRDQYAAGGPSTVINDNKTVSININGASADMEERIRRVLYEHQARRGALGNRMAAGVMP